MKTFPVMSELREFHDLKFLLSVYLFFRLEYRDDYFED
jgi:hypothetical protein